MDGGNIAYYWIAAVTILTLYLIIDEYKRK
ncbi:hypothetical protein immuto35A_174 [Flavobacterium phage vB_FspM_immuto_3-5A]|jgi:hypothetical protein|uniref:Uncharacterized protein n=1 Tax=Flavobacterium phage vB_FspM_immuto_2-6A TaxID=2801477 RepID=A0A7T8ERH8_9CAUD|nr:hypothetical protein KNV73_gp096 [Flavobacterium phage vB_FspM_immuto_2-6A]QQO91854.1 hypothetical protein immuto26A_175 [Flavobacterium phage vB_FspM_immuto_2-6A]QQO92092.1 hypothetical protein immuto35A_174 [Flavobacterium phage vB_FspM_immuto_3-5A]QQO92330.1 hypothetical protein immuto136C_174 [Flavobacterium phage vB_FspM_immuto_13-6C]